MASKVLSRANYRRILKIADLLTETVHREERVVEMEESADPRKSTKARNKIKIYEELTRYQKRQGKLKRRGLHKKPREIMTVT